MKRVGQIAFWVLLGLPTFALVIFLGASATLSCEMNPYNGFTCPDFFAYLMPFAAIGYITIIPFGVIGIIWSGFEIAMRVIARRR